MLKNLRNKKTAKKIWVILAILILPAFLFWGMGSAIRSKNESGYVGKIFGKKISLVEYKDAADAVRNIAVMRFGPQFSEIQKSLNLEEQAWERLILLAEAKRRKIIVKDEEVIDTLRNHPLFQRKGKFDPELYNSALKYMLRTQARVFEEQTRQNLMLLKLYEQIVSGVNLSQDEVKNEYRKVNQKISIYYVASNPTNFTKGINPSENELQEYFNQHALELKHPPSFKLEYLILDSEDQVGKTLLQIRKKEDLGKIAKDNNLEIKVTDFLTQNDPIPDIGWQPQIMEAISRIKTDEYLPALKIDKHFFLIKLKERKDSFIPDFQTSKEKILDNYRKDRSLVIAREKIKECLQKLKDAYAQNPKPGDLNKVASELGLKFAETTAFIYGTYIEGIGASERMWLDAEALSENQISDIIELPSGFYIIKLKSKEMFDEKKFKEEKAEFEKNILLQKKNEAFGKFLEELFKEARR
jgi:peptidyl-prolyl cis-trans isomerase D